jgi:O-methyltransferase
MRKIKNAIKTGLLASRIPPAGIFDFANMYFRFARFVRAHRKTCRVFRERPQLYEFVGRDVLHHEAIDYFEFGVFEGHSFREWMTLNTHKESRFFGFDTFEGLPEDWHNDAFWAMPKGSMSVQGKLPHFEDIRGQLIKGVFQESLRPFLQTFSARNRLVVNCDADLYSSTLYALAMMDSFIRPSTIILFDEFDAVQHEFRACLDYCAAFRRTMRPLAFAGPVYNHAAFEVLS